MNTLNNDDQLILAVFPAVRGFGFALFQGPWVPLDWGFRHVQGDKNENALLKAHALLNAYTPDILLLEDHQGEGSRRSDRVATLIDAIADEAERRGIAVTCYSRNQIRECFAEFGATTKYEIAQAISRSLPEFPPQLPPERKIWLPEDTRMSIFDAVSLIFTHFFFQAIKPDAPAGTHTGDTSQEDQSVT